MSNFNQQISKKVDFSVLSTIKKTIFTNGLTNTGRFLIARILYADGLVVAIAGLGIFASSVINLSFKELLLLALIGNVLGGIGCFSSAFLKIPDKKILMISLMALSIVVFLMAISTDKIYFITLVSIGTFFAGPLQSASRSIMSNLMPHESQGIGFGLFTASGKITAFIGPLLSAILTFYISQRVGYGFSAVLLLLGLILLLKVKTE
jgi:UMF1 family MFS transporter